MKNSEAELIVKRYEYEEPYHTQLEFIISNGSFSSTIDFYCNVEDIKKIGEALSSFPQKIDDEFSYTNGSDDPNDRHYRLFTIRAYTTDGVGHCAIQFKVNLNQSEPSEGQSVFSIVTEAAAINKLGKLFVKFSSLEHKELHWSNDIDELFESHQ